MKINRHLLLQLVVIFSFILAFTSPITLNAFQINGKDLANNAQETYLLSETQDTFYKVNIEKEISLDLKKATMAEALKAVSQKTGFKLTYRGIFGSDKKITIKNKNISVGKALSQILEGTNFDYKVSQKGYLLIHEVVKSNMEVFFQTVSGTVTDAQTGNSMPGVNIVVKGTTAGTSSNSEGEYELEVSSLQDTLVFSFIGYQTKEVAINGRQTINITLSPQLLEAEELTVVAYGVQRKSDITGSISSVEREDFNKGVVVNPGQLLQGVVAGVNVTSTSGEPGAAQDVIIRGVGSLRSGSQPLYVIDGFALEDNSSSGVATNPLNYINPDDIESMEVLKDASATALYGARASNGVVVITTKKGQAGDTRMTFSSRNSFSTIANKIDLFSANQFRNQVPQAGGTLDDFGANTEWQDVLTQTAFSHDLNFSVSGAASDQFNYFTSVGVQNQEGILNGSRLKRFSGRLNMNQKAYNGRLDVDYRLTAVRTENLRPNITATVSDMLSLNPTRPVFTNGSPTQLDARLNPVQRNELFLDEAINNRLFANISPTINIFEGLSYKLNLGIDFSVTDRDVQTSPFAQLEGLENGRLTSSDNKNTNTLVENTLTYKFDRNTHSITTLVGHSFQKFTVEASTLSAEGFSENNIQPRFQDQISTDITPTTINSSAGINKLLSFFWRTNYIYDDRYLLTATMRADGSSRFGDNNQYGYFPSVALGWNITNERFFNSSFVENIKLRTSWGRTGNQDIPNKITQESFDESRSGNNTFPLDDGDNSLDDFPFGRVFTRIANPDLQWEVTRQIDVGLDFELFNNRLSGTFDYFNKESKKVLLEVVAADPVQPTSTFWTNIPDMKIKNSGIEFSLEYRSDFTKDFQYSISGNVSTNNNEVVDSPFNVLTTGAAQGAGQTGATINGNLNGEPVGSFFMLEFDGIGEDGLNRFVDTNNDGAILEDDRIVAGSALPDYLYGIQFNMNYKNLGLGLNFNGAGGHQLFNHTALSLFMPGNLAGSNNTTDFATEFPEESPSNSNTVSTRFLEDADYLRLNSATLSYNIRPEVIGLDGKIRNLELTVTGQNLFVITSYNGFDPEVNTGDDIGGIQTFGIDRFTFPSARTVLLGVNLTF